MNKSDKLFFIALLFLSFFTFPLISNIAGILLPFWKETFHLNNTMASIPGAMIFLASGLTAMPQGTLLNKAGSKNTLIFGNLLIFLGATIFGFIPRYETGIICLFIMGAGITAVNMTANLLVKYIDNNPDKYSKNLTISQTFCSIGAASGGFFLGILMGKAGFQWKSIYFVFSVLSGLLIFYSFLLKFPEEEKAVISSNKSSYLELIKNPLMLMFALGIFIYLGIEFGIASWISTFLADNHNMSKFDAAKTVSFFWILQGIGRFSAGFILSKINASKALIIYSLNCLIFLLAATLSPNIYISVISFILIGFFTSIMFPCIFSTAVNSFEKRHENSVGGILCTATVGGAFFAPIIGFISDLTNSLTIGLTIMGVVSFLYLAFLGFIAYNKKINTK